MTDFKYVGGGHYRDASVPKGQPAETLHGDELTKRHEAELASLRQRIADLEHNLEVAGETANIWNEKAEALEAKIEAVENWRCIGPDAPGDDCRFQPIDEMCPGCAAHYLSDRATEAEQRIAELTRPNWDRWVGPCVHGSDPWNRCEQCAPDERQALAWALHAAERRATEAESEREALIEKAAVAVEDTDIETYRGWEGGDDARATLRSAAANVRALTPRRPNDGERG